MSREGGKCCLAGDVPTGSVQGAGEGDPVGIEAGLVGGVVDSFPERVVDEEEPVDLLLDTGRITGPQDKLVSSLVRFDLVECVLDLPSLVVEGGEFFRRRLGGIADGGDQPVDRVVIVAERVLDHSDRGWIAMPVVAAGDDPGQIGAVVKVLEDRQDDVLADPP